MRQSYAGENPAGRPNTFWFDGYKIFTPFDRFLIARELVNGGFQPRQQRYREPVLQVVVAPREQAIACTFLSATDYVCDIVIRTAGSDREVILSGHEQIPWRIAFSPDASRLISCADDGSFRLWNTATGAELNRFPGYRTGGNFGTVRGQFVAFSADGKWLATVFDDVITLRKPQNGSEVSRWQPTDDHWRSAAIRFSPKSDFLYAFRGGDFPGNLPRVAQLDLRKDRVNDKGRQFIGESPAYDAVWIADDRMVSWYSNSPYLTIWDTVKASVVKQVQGSSRGVYDVDLSPDGRMLASVGNDDLLKFWRLPEMKLLAAAPEYRQDECDFIRFSADGKSLVTTGVDAVLKIWDAP